MHPAKIIKIPSSASELGNNLVKQLGVSPILARLLLNRGIKTPLAAEKFLNINLDNLYCPHSFKDMACAVDTIRRIIANKEKILIFGDYDVDGVTSVALLKETLLKMGGHVSHYLPHRIKEGYGLSKGIVKLAKDENIKLLITVDCGINNCEEVRGLRSLDIDVIITDHHEPQDDNLPNASAIINPKLKNSNYGYRELAGVGVTYKLCQAITEDKLVNNLDLVCLGTIADVVPLTGENRIIAGIGLSVLSETKRPGLCALIENSGIRNRKLTSTSIGYILGPRINASGRMDTAEDALELLITNEQIRAGELAQQIEKYNRQRQRIENIIIEEAYGLIERQINFKDHKIIVISNEGWHEGVLGIVAAKLADKFYRPTVIISKAEGLCKGSARSIKNFHLFEALCECKELLDSFGGHSHAAGLSIRESKIEEFKKKINTIASKKLKLEHLLPTLDIDMEIDLEDLDEKTVTQLERLEPFGADNPKPLFYTRNLMLKGIPQILSKDTLKFWVSDGKFTYQAIGFRKAFFRDSLMNSDSFDLAYTPRMDSWWGDNNILLEIEEVFSK